MSSTRTNVHIWWDTSVQAYRLTSSFSRYLVDGLKAVIPVSDRSFDPTTKVWTFVERQLVPLQSLLKQLGVTPMLITRQQTEAAQQQAQSPAVQRGKPLDAVIIEFVRLLPYDAAKTAYRKAAVELHPDKNAGDGSRMSALNTAWDRLQKEVYGQQ